MVIDWCDVDSVLCVCQQRLQNQAVLANRKNPLREQTSLAEGQQAANNTATIIQTSADQVIRETGREGGRERKGGRQGDLVENEEGQECIQGQFDEKKWDIEDRREQTGFRRHSVRVLLTLL